MPQTVHDQIPHGISQARRIVAHRLLHVHAEYMIHDEFEDFPWRTGGHGKGKQGHETRPDLHAGSLLLVEDVDQQDAEHLVFKQNAYRQPGSCIAPA